MTAHEELSREQWLDVRGDERKCAILAVLHAAWDVGFCIDVLDETAKGKVAYWLAEGTKKRRGAWPDPATTKLQRAWDALCLLDDEAESADRAACRDVFAEDES